MRAFLRGVAYWFVIIIGLGFFMPSTPDGVETGAENEESYPPVLSFLLSASPFLAAGASFWRGKTKTEGRLKKKTALLAAERQRLETEFTYPLVRAVDQHAPVLSRKLKSAVKRNDYGAVTADNTDKVINEFLSSVGLDATGVSPVFIHDTIISRVRDYEDRSATKGFDLNSLPADGLEFERWVAQGLKQFGWSAYETQGSNDQGIDVIAERSGMRLGIQCKLYGTAVGNSAVQEAVAGRQFHNLDRAAVLATAGFTRSAEELATANKVLLITPADLANLHSRLGLDQQA